MEEITDSGLWNAIVDAMPGSFLTQLWEWGVARESGGWEPHRLIWTANSGTGVPSAAVQLLVRRVPVVGWGVAYAPRGPLGDVDQSMAEALGASMTEWARANRVATLVVDPAVDAESNLGRVLLRPPWRDAPALGEQRVHILELPNGVDPWLNVRRKHREWIRRADKAGVDVVWSDGDTSPAAADAAWHQFVRVYEEVVARLGLVTGGPAITRRVWEEFRQSRRAHLLTATLDGVPVAAMLHVICGDAMIWYAGGQTATGASVGAGKLAMWRSIERARELGVRRYHMWGTATDSLAHYKEGFGAHEERYIGTRSAPVHRGVDLLVHAAWSGRQRLRGTPR